MTTTHLKALGYTMAFLAFLSCPPARAQTSVAPAEARIIAKEAYIYGYPMVDSYHRIEYAYFVDPKNPEYKGPWNQLRNFSHAVQCITESDIRV